MHYKGFYLRNGKEKCKKLIFEIIYGKKGKIPIEFMCSYFKYQEVGTISGAKGGV